MAPVLRSTIDPRSDLFAANREAMLAALAEIDGLYGQITAGGGTIENTVAGQTLTLSERAESALAAGVTIVMHKPLGYVSGQPEPDKIPAVRLLTEAELNDMDGDIPF